MSVVNVATLAEEIYQSAREVDIKGEDEEALKIRLEEAFRREAWSKLGVPRPKYEYRIRTIYGIRRPDALYGLTIFEYKRPGTLKKPSALRSAVEQVKKYIEALRTHEDVRAILNMARKEGLLPRLIGVIIDGYMVYFIEYDPYTGMWREEGPSEIKNNPEIIRRIVRTVIATYRKRLDAKLLAIDFGYESKVARKAVQVFYRKLMNPKSSKTVCLFEEWRTLASQAYALSPQELAKVASYYGLPEKINGEKLFFAIQTYYSLIVKLIAVEVASCFYDAAVASYFDKIRQAIGKPKELKLSLIHI